MKAVVQRVNNACVKVDGSVVGTIEDGLFVLLGVCEGDGVAEAELLAKKVANLRIFCDENDKMNLSVIDVGGSVLTVSNFTLCANTSKGNRPSFIGAMGPAAAETLYEYFVEQLELNGVKCTQKGEFGADMQISNELTGPVTIILDTDVWCKK